MHAVGDTQPALSGGHDSEAEAWRSRVCQQHGYPDPNAPRYSTLAEAQLNCMCFCTDVA